MTANWGLETTKHNSNIWPFLNRDYTYNKCIVFKHPPHLRFPALCLHLIHSLVKHSKGKKPALHLWPHGHPESYQLIKKVVPQSSPSTCRALISSSTARNYSSFLSWPTTQSLDRTTAYPPVWTLTPPPFLFPSNAQKSTASMAPTKSQGAGAVQEWGKRRVQKG